MRIHRLPEDLTSRIAAGEVIERPVSVVKELLENALDAKASRINLSLVEGGKASIVLEDDGVGIAFEDLPLAVERYATSKISSMEDLEAIKTLGYRGEALSSIAAVSRLELRSRPKDSEEGGLLRAEGGKITLHVKTSCLFGTRVQVRDLFFNLPARLKFLKSSAAEQRRILQLFNDYALANPKVVFALEVEGKKKVLRPALLDTQEALRYLWGQEARIEESHIKSGTLSIDAWWLPAPGSRRTQILSFVNGRRVEDPVVRSAVASVGKDPSGQWFFSVSIPYEEVDVNVHPRKEEIRYRKSGPVFELVRHCAVELLSRASEVREPFFYSKTELSEGHFHEVSLETSREGAGELRVASPSCASLFPKDEEKKILRETNADQAPSIQRGVYLGQVCGGYLLFDSREKLTFVDPHAAHERIYFEEISQRSASGKRSQIQVYPTPIPRGLWPSVLEQRDRLVLLGFEITDQQPDGDPGAITRIPSLPEVGALSPIELLRAALEVLETREVKDFAWTVWGKWARLACQSAVKLGARITEEEAFSLLDRLLKCEQPYSCPHGRPTIIFIDRNVLERLFGRKD